MKLARGLKYSLEIILLLLVIFLCFIWWSFTTPGGTKRILSATQHRLQNVSYQYESGNLLDGVVLKEARWQLKNGTAVSGRNLHITSNPSCWQSRELCIDSGIIEQLTVSLPLTKVDTNEITLKNLSLLLSIRAKSISVKKLVINHPSRPAITFLNAELSGSISESNITLTRFNTTWNRMHLHGAGTVTMQDHYPINMQGSASRSMGSGLLQADWLARGNLKSLELDAKFSKPFKAQLAGVVSLLDRRLPADMTLVWDRIALPLKHDTPVLIVAAGKVDIGGRWPDYTTRGNAMLSGPNLPSGTADLSGSVSTNALRFEPLAINTLGGHILSKGRVTWNQDIQWKASVDAKDLKPEQNWPHLNGHISATGELAGTMSDESSELRIDDINATGRINGHPLKATGHISRDNTQKWRIDNLQLNNANNNLSANGVVGDSVKLVFSLLSAESFLPGASGDLNGDLTITNDPTNPTIEGSVTTANFQYKNIHLQNARGNGIVRELGHDQSDLYFQAQSVEVNDRLIQNPDLSFNGSLDDHLLRLKLSSDPMDSVDLEVVGSKDEHHNWNGTVNSVRSTMADRLLSLANPFTATWIHENRTLAVEPHCWLYDFASVCVEESALIGRTGVVNFALNRLPLESIKEFLPDDIELTGNLQSSGNLIWGPNQKTTVTVDSYLEDATALINKTINNNKLKMEFPVAELNITTEGYKINSKLTLESDKFSTLSADISINTARKSLPIQGTVNLDEGQLSWIRDFLPDINLLNGKLDGNAAVSGSLFDPIINGEIRLQNGEVQSALLPIDIKEINIGVNVKGNDAIVEGTALANDTEVILNGTGVMTPEGFSSDLHLVGKGIKVQHEYARNAVLSPDLRFKIRPNNIDIAGTVNVPSAEITIQNFASDGVALSKDVIVTDELLTDNSPSAVGSTGINTRVNVSLGRDVTVDAFGLNADLSGDFQFTLAAEKPPSLAGAIAVSEGNYQAYGQKLKIRDGEITFTGPIEQTAISVEAVREIKGLLAGVRIAGTIQNPTTNLFSEPSIPEEDILPYIVLGRKLDFGEADSGLLRKAALMLGVDTGQRVSSKLARSLGIDDFSLSAWGTGDDTQILVSGKLNDRLLLRYGVGVFKNNNSLYLRYDLADRFYLETTQGIESAVDLFYAFDF